MPPEIDVRTVFSDLVRAETRLYNALDDRLQAELGITVGRFEMLEFIAACEQCRVFDIANAFALTVGAASKAVDRIEGDRLCTRTTNPDDRRSSHLAITAAGRRLLLRARPLFEDEARRRFGEALSARGLAQLAVGVAALRQSLELDGRTGGVGRQAR